MATTTTTTLPPVATDGEPTQVFSPTILWSCARAALDDIGREVSTGAFVLSFEHGERYWEATLTKKGPPRSPFESRWVNLETIALAPRPQGWPRMGWPDRYRHILSLTKSHRRALAACELRSIVEEGDEVSDSTPSTALRWGLKPSSVYRQISAELVAPESRTATHSMLATLHMVGLVAWAGYPSGEEVFANPLLRFASADVPWRTTALGDLILRHVPAPGRTTRA